MGGIVGGAEQVHFPDREVAPGDGVPQPLADSGGEVAFHAAQDEVAPALLALPADDLHAGDQLSATISANAPRSAASRVSRPSRWRAAVSAATSSWVAAAVSIRAWAIFARAWLSLLRTVPTGTSQAAAICS
ncbi:hypothetical protein [Amycolatopsis sp.]|uniref:hypothetical protein n=1 Tax=Amycolatopsis sp. TaxID=37632 RepID=UPI0026329B5A|nr:hypothetical protein [Amycolatopsis sp.]